MALLEIGTDALLARIHLIRAARDNIAIQTMIWVNDETGRLLIYELIQAAKRGVKVQLLIDHIASEQNLEIATSLAYIHPNFKIRLFNPVSSLFNQPKVKPLFLEKLYSMLFKFHSLNHRMHNKTFIVDGLIGITGGRNYQNAYYDQAPGMNYKDRDILATGPVVSEMHDSFIDYWDSRYAVSLANLRDVKAYKKHGHISNLNSRDSFQLNGLFERVDYKANHSELIKERFVDAMNGVAEAYFIADNPGKRNRQLLWYGNDSKIARELATLVAGASRSVYIQTPYLILTSSAYTLFKELREEHPEIDVRISTNSLAATDSWYVYALSYKQKQSYLQGLKFKIYEFKPLPADIELFVPTLEQLRDRSAKTKVSKLDPETQLSITEGKGEPYLCLHGKSMIVDEEISFVGSYNLDPRSENINTESGLVVRDKQFARLLRTNIETDMQPRNAWVIARKKIPLWLGQPNALLAKISDLIPLVDIWPFRYATSFELIEGKQNVDVNHPDFYLNFRDVGSFPQINEENVGKEIGARGTKAFLSFVKPLL